MREDMLRDTRSSRFAESELWNRRWTSRDGRSSLAPSPLSRVLPRARVTCGFALILSLTMSVVSCASTEDLTGRTAFAQTAMQGPPALSETEKSSAANPSLGGDHESGDGEGGTDSPSDRQTEEATAIKEQVSSETLPPKAIYERPSLAAVLMELLQLMPMEVVQYILESRKELGDLNGDDTGDEEEATIGIESLLLKWLHNEMTEEDHKDEGLLYLFKVFLQSLIYFLQNKREVGVQLLMEAAVLQNHISKGDLTNEQALAELAHSDAFQEVVRHMNSNMISAVEAVNARKEIDSWRANGLLSPSSELP